MIHRTQTKIASFALKSSLFAMCCALVACKLDGSGSESLSIGSLAEVPSELQRTAWKMSFGNCSYFHIFDRTERTDIVSCEVDGVQQKSFSTYNVRLTESDTGSITLTSVALRESSCKGTSSLNKIGHTFHMIHREDSSDIWTRFDPESNFINPLTYQKVDSEVALEQMKDAGCHVGDKYVAYERGDRG